MNKVIGELKASELIYIFVGALFILNAVVLYIGGGYGLLIATKIAYAIGFIFLLLNK